MWRQFCSDWLRTREHKSAKSHSQWNLHTFATDLSQVVFEPRPHGQSSSTTHLYWRSIESLCFELAAKSPMRSPCYFVDGTENLVITIFCNCLIIWIVPLATNNCWSTPSRGVSSAREYPQFPRQSLVESNIPRHIPRSYAMFWRANWIIAERRCEGWAGNEQTSTNRNGISLPENPFCAQSEMIKVSLVRPASNDRCSFERNSWDTWTYSLTLGLISRSLKWLIGVDVSPVTVFREICHPN